MYYHGDQTSTLASSYVIYLRTILTIPSTSYEKRGRVTELVKYMQSSMSRMEDDVDEMIINQVSNEQTHACSNYGDVDTGNVD